jgi:hypothetical protein
MEGVVIYLAHKSRPFKGHHSQIWFRGFKEKDLNVIVYQNMPNLHNRYKSAEQNIYNILLINMTQSCQIKQRYIESNTGGEYKIGKSLTPEGKISIVLFTSVLFINKPYLILTNQMRMLTIILQLQLLQPKLCQCIWNRIKKARCRDVHCGLGHILRNQ